MSQAGRFQGAKLPAWIERHPKRDYPAALYLGRTRNPGDWYRVKAIYQEAQRLRVRGEDVVVDHIEPLLSPWVCGLHHSANLRTVSRSENARKGNGAEHPVLPLPAWPPYQLPLFR